MSFFFSPFKATPHSNSTTHHYSLQLQLQREFQATAPPLHRLFAVVHHHICPCSPSYLCLQFLENISEQYISALLRGG
ncbi:hypothetical protein QVD17_18425 [Tagetes erecta]|uniref:Uncharacterized protein n=1 Tax=Tagetes erecta TaxID=13708 RepID=A0AAD8KP19_TARER|nr:hypothetical protein QVD17_18425 [Tagetes erecta]